MENSASVELAVSDVFFLHRRGGWVGWWWWWCARGPDEKCFRDNCIKNAMCMRSSLFVSPLEDPSSITSKMLPCVQKTCFFSKKTRGPLERNTISLNKPPIFLGGLSCKTKCPLVSQHTTFVSQDTTSQKPNATILKKHQYFARPSPSLFTVVSEVMGSCRKNGEQHFFSSTD